MDQPQLGKKISELRKAKGLTQEELVTMCNLSVRTLQRIESGDVMPRSFTIKAIFAALDYNVYNTFAESTENILNAEIDKYTWLEQFYRYVTDLFNLKTNIMRKLTILSALTICLAFIFTSVISAQSSSTEKNKLVGTWIQVDSTGNAIIGNPGNTVQYKIITPECFSVSGINKSTKTFIGIFIGTYNMDNDIYTEVITYANPGTKNMVGYKNTFKCKFERDLWYIKGTNNPYAQYWKRVKADF